jgi:Protein of unknown function (DUF2933)
MAGTHVWVAGACDGKGMAEEGGQMNSQHRSMASSWFRSRTGLVLLAFLAIAAFFLITEHRAHVLGVLPFLLVLLCPLLHLFLHGRHGGGHAGHGSRPSQRPEGGER